LAQDWLGRFDASSPRPRVPLRRTRCLRVASACCGDRRRSLGRTGLELARGSQDLLEGRPIDVRQAGRPRSSGGRARPEGSPERPEVGGGCLEWSDDRLVPLPDRTRALDEDIPMHGGPTSGGASRSESNRSQPMPCSWTSMASGSTYRRLRGLARSAVRGVRHLAGN
jgi:hypothetical protein